MILVDFAPALPELFSLGLVGVGLVSWLGDDGSDEVDQDGDAGEDFDMEDDEDFGMDDFDDDFGGMEDMDEGGGGGASSTELENRIEDLESEVANVSSTANTVRSENEQISEKVEDVEENVRKLLEIYEMVTRGVNPFVDDVGAEAGVGGGGADFGLFAEEEESAEEADEDLGTDIADAEAEEFFEDDAFDDEFDDGEAFDEGEDFDPEDDSLDEEFGDDGMEEFGGGDMVEEEFDDFEEESATEDEGLDDDGTEMTDTGEDSSGGSDGGTSFEELKAEYESGEADWAEEEDLDEPATETETTETETEPAAEPDEQQDLFHQDDLEAEAESTSESVQSETPAGTDAPSEPTETTTEQIEEAGTVPTESASGDVTSGAESESGDVTPRAEPEPEPTPSEEPDAGFQFGAATAADSADQPHLDAPPNGYLSDVLIMEWLDFLVGEFDARNAIRAINHYERIGWIGESMRDHCYEVLQGVADGEYPYRDESGPTELSMEDHRRSLRYIENLATGHLDKELGNRLTSLKTNGVQR